MSICHLFSLWSSRPPPTEYGGSKKRETQQMSRAIKSGKTRYSTYKHSQCKWRKYVQVFVCMYAPVVYPNKVCPCVCFTKDLGQRRKKKGGKELFSFFPLFPSLRHFSCLFCLVGERQKKVLRYVGGTHMYKKKVQYFATCYDDHNSFAPPLY